MIVSDTSPLIFLSNHLILLKKCFREISIPSAVFKEIMRKKDGIDSVVISQENWIKRIDTTINPLLNTKRIGLGEKEAISLAKKEKSMLLIDDDVAKSYAQLLGVECHGTLYVLLMSAKKGYVRKSQAKKIIQEIIGNGFYISTDIYIRFVEMLDRVSK